MTSTLRGFITTQPNPSTRSIDLGSGSEVFYNPRFVAPDRAWEWFDYLNKEIPWTRPTIRVFGKSCLQPRDTCYVASEGLSELKYSGYQPHTYSWDDYPVLKSILEAVHEALPGSRFNSLLLNRYNCGSDYVAWHSDDEKLYGATPEIASVSFGCEREFLLKKKPIKSPQGCNPWCRSRSNASEATKVGPPSSAFLCIEAWFFAGNERLHPERLESFGTQACKS